MRAVEPPFDLDFKGELIRIAEHELQGKRVFHVDFKDSRKSLVVAVGLGFRDVRFWTSIPQGR
ncbi:hypothetical protein QG516_03920 [Pedobacter gandavensis]|uniref:hypothetical protein n=1 Tax=Pedobacter gandavensis TaxID=2679963 RepID=UPI00247A9056|nr:hypothetical protein [Pedobacter gandavensis]WGQ10800.1 hypothetical protein QG516_03920 [Pedobacter gandavensis]